jgi:hypothetical protein
MAKKTDATVPTSDPLKDFQQVLIDEAARFVKDNAADVAALGEDVVRAVLFEQMSMQSLDAFTADAHSLNACAELETMATERTRAFQLVAKAFAQDAKRVAKLRAAAQDTVGKIAVSAVLTLAGIAMKALLSK